MTVPDGTIIFTGPVVDVTGELLAPTPELRDAGAVSLLDGRLQKVNAAGDAWVDIPGHAIDAAEPDNPFLGQLWYDTGSDDLKSYNGTAFVNVDSGGGGGGTGDDAAAWAEEGNTDLIPAAKFRAPTATARGGVAGAINSVIDNETGNTWLAWTVSNVRRLTRRLVNNWAYSGNTDLIPDAKTGVTGAVNTHDSDLGSHASAQRVLNQDPNADADTLGKLQIDPQGNAYTTEPDTEHGTAQDADFARFTHADYIGELSGEPNPLAQTLGTYYFLIVDHKLQVTANNSFGQLRWEDADWSDLLVAGAGYRGVRSGDAGALPHIHHERRCLL